MASITAETPAAATELPSIRGTIRPVPSDDSPDAVVLAFPRLMASQGDILTAARNLIEHAYALTRSEAIARVLVEADELLEHLVVD